MTDNNIGQKEEGMEHKPDLQAIETRYMDAMINHLMQRFDLSLPLARDMGRDIFYTFVFPIYELGGQYGFVPLTVLPLQSEVKIKEARIRELEEEMAGLIEIHHEQHKDVEVEKDSFAIGFNLWIVRQGIRYDTRMQKYGIFRGDDVNTLWLTKEEIIEEYKKTTLK